MLYATCQLRSSVAGTRLLQRSHQLVRKNTLSHERVSPRGQRLVAALYRHTVNDNTYCGPARLHLRRGSYPIHARHPHVQEHHVRLQVCNPSHGLVPIGRLADYVEPCVRCQQGSQRTARTRAIVDDEEAN
jgi:hypothetical protein